jgi:hypothetical protein
VDLGEERDRVDDVLDHLVHVHDVESPGFEVCGRDLADVHVETADAPREIGDGREDLHAGHLPPGVARDLEEDPLVAADLQEAIRPAQRREPGEQAGVLDALAPVRGPRRPVVVRPVEVFDVGCEFRIDVVHEDELAATADPEPLVRPEEEALRRGRRAHEALRRLGTELEPAPFPRGGVDEGVFPETGGRLHVQRRV